MKITAVIPARISSTRLPEKPIALLANKPIIQWVYENVKLSKYINEVIVATDSEKIKKVVEGFGGKAELTLPTHPSGTDRVAEVAKRLDAEIIINIQGDEPFITKEVIDEVLRFMIKDQSILMGSAKTNVIDIGEVFNPNVVKVICDENDFAIYFSRAPIPYFRDEYAQYKKTGKVDKYILSEILNKVFKHIGIYAFRWDFLIKYAKMKPTFLEKAEKLEQLRAVERGVKIKVPTVKYDGFGIDTKEDLERALKKLQGKGL